MVTPKGCKLLEFNCRFGDPETEVLMRLLDSDLYTICVACSKGTLASTEINWKAQNVVGIVLASEGYPAKPTVNRRIQGIPEHNEETVVFHAGTKITEDGLVTSGGRVLCVVSIGNSFQEARNRALAVSEQIKFEGKYYRKDIGHFLLNKGNVSYSASGVDIAEGNALIASIKDVCLATRTPGTESIGGFGALVDLKAEGFNTPQLVIGMDGVGTKIAVAEATGHFDGLGYDLVGMCVNDVLCHCARPVAFLDYYVTGRLVKEEAAAVIRSIAKACKESGCALVGGETAEMPGVYNPGQWDVAGCCIGAREASWPQLPLTDSVSEGDVLLALPSNGLHSNGFSLVRKIVSDNGFSYKEPAPWNPLVSIGEELLRPTKLYVKSVIEALKSGKVKAIAHITGGGITENLPRVFPEQVAGEIQCGSWPVPEVFDWLHSNGPVAPAEMLKTFNCGVGLVLVVSAENQEAVTDSLLEHGESAIYKIGNVVKKTTNEQIVYKTVENTFKYRFVKTQSRKINVGILISGAGSNMKKLIEKSLYNKSNCSVRVVISNKADAGGIAIARSYGIETVVVPSVGEREQYEALITQELEKRGIELICLAGFMRILTASFVNRWKNRIINIHPSLLPSFKGAHAVKLALEAGVKVAGCTAHFADVEVDAGAIIAQETVPVYKDDT
uniref:phosphoribosylformylglycinamidine cyclo-ligase n=1 Tax=Steinernema glaseri TaxID=37863 RepID=A0A1I7ZM16_9BILA